jgi:hypothetical protein
MYCKTGYDNVWNLIIHVGISLRMVPGENSRDYILNVEHIPGVLQKWCFFQLLLSLFS